MSALYITPPISSISPFNFNPAMDKYIYYKVWDEITYSYYVLTS